MPGAGSDNMQVNKPAEHPNPYKALVLFSDKQNRTHSKEGSCHRCAYAEVAKSCEQKKNPHTAPTYSTYPTICVCVTVRRSSGFQAVT